jgi:hypothetical protein
MIMRRREAGRQISVFSAQLDYTEQLPRTRFLTRSSDLEDERALRELLGDKPSK